MRIVEAPGTLRKYRRTAWKFQQTFHTPLDDLPRFVDVILSALPGLRASQAVLEQVVFEPRAELVPLYSKYSISLNWRGDAPTLEAAGPAESRELLQALLSEWIDFFFVPTPRPLVIYADHDEFITFLAHRKAPLSAVSGALAAAKFRPADYVREF